MELVETEAPCVRNRHDPWAQLLSQWVSPHSRPLPPLRVPRLCSATRRGLLPSAASKTSVTGHPDLRGVGANSPHAHTTPTTPHPPSSPLCGAAEGSPVSVRGVGQGGKEGGCTVLWGGGFHLGATRLMVFGVTREKGGGTAPAVRGGAVQPQPGLEPAALVRGAAPSAGAATTGADPGGLQGGSGPLGRNPSGAGGKHRNVTVVRRRPPQGAQAAWMGPPLPPRFCRGPTPPEGLDWPRFLPAPLSTPTPVK